MRENRQAGLTMIELMIAMVIGLILTAAVLQVFVGSRVTYSTQSSLAKIQENGRIAMEYLTYDLRQTAYVGCAENNTITNVVGNNAGVDDFYNVEQAINGRNDTAAGLSYDGQTVRPGTDVVSVKYAIPGNTCTVSRHDKDQATITCQNNHLFQQGDVLILSSCSKAHNAVFQQTNVNAGAENTILHKSGSTLSPGNCFEGLGKGTNCVDGTEYDHTFQQGDVILQLATYRYFIANNGFGEPALWREEIASNNVGGNVVLSTAARELVEGVENMQVLYGVDTSDDKRPNKYVDVSEVSAADMDNVVAVRVSLLLQSNEERVVEGNQTLRFNGADLTFNDGRLRKVFTSTIALRNRM